MAGLDISLDTIDRDDGIYHCSFTTEGEDGLVHGKVDVRIIDGQPVAQLTQIQPENANVELHSIKQAAIAKVRVQNANSAPGSITASKRNDPLK